MLFLRKLLGKADNFAHRHHLVGDAWWQQPGRMVCDLWDWDNFGPPAPWLQKWLRLKQRDTFPEGAVWERVTPPK